MTPKSPAPIDSAKVEDTGEPDAFTLEAAKGVHSAFNACMYREQCRAALAAPTPSTQAVGEPDTVMHNGKDIMQIWFECNRDVFNFYDRITAPTTGSAPDGWISAADRLPDVKKGTEREFIVACRRARNGKTYVFAASYLNQMGLMSDDDDCPEDGRPTTGWFNERNDIEYDNAFQIVCDEGDEVTHWMPLPDAPALLAASMGGEPK